MRSLHRMRQAKLWRRKNLKHPPPPAAAAMTPTPTPDLSSAAPSFSPTTPALILSPTAPSFTPSTSCIDSPTKSRSELWAEAAQPPTPTPSSIHLTPSSTSSHDLWAEPVPPPSPTPSSMNLSHITPTSPIHTNSPSPPHANNFETWPPISPIRTCQETFNLTNMSMNDTYLHTPNNHMLNELPQNLTIMNDTYIPYNFYKI